MNVKTKLCEVTGIAPQVYDEILIEVKANQAKLASCSSHDFSIVLDRSTKKPIENPTNVQRFGANYQCSKCGGRVDSHARYWYDLGQTHAMIAATK